MSCGSCGSTPTDDSHSRPPYGEHVGSDENIWQLFLAFTRVQMIRTQHHVMDAMAEKKNKGTVGDVLNHTLLLFYAVRVGSVTWLLSNLPDANVSSRRDERIEAN
ncbi:uncharacterized protein V6R79_005013 [Siganus canaliculatus]